MVTASPELRLSEQIISPAMKTPMIVSVIFHAFLVIAFSIGVPYTKREPISIVQPISVEIVDIDELAQADKIATPIAKPKAERKTPPKPKSAPRMVSQKPPDLTKPKPPKVDTKQKPRVVAPPKPLQRKNIEKPKPKPKEPDTTKALQPAQRDPFQSLLKNLTPDANEERVQKTPDESPQDSQNAGQLSKLSDRLTISEQDALRRQLSQCWNVMAGAKYAEDLVVELRVIMNPDRTVNSASILDRSRYNRDTHFRAAAEAALRALRNPQCSPLALPAEKYDQWQSIVLTFDPRDML